VKNTGGQKKNPEHPSLTKYERHDCVWFSTGKKVYTDFGVSEHRICVFGNTERRSHTRKMNCI